MRHTSENARDPRTKIHPTRVDSYVEVCQVNAEFDYVFRCIGTEISFRKCVKTRRIRNLKKKKKMQNDSNLAVNEPIGRKNRSTGIGRRRRSTRIGHGKREDGGESRVNTDGITGGRRACRHVLRLDRKRSRTAFRDDFQPFFPRPAEHRADRSYICWPHAFTHPHAVLPPIVTATYANTPAAAGKLWNAMYVRPSFDTWFMSAISSSRL